MTTEPTYPDQRYMFDQAWLAEQRRLAALQTIWDPFTIANLEALDLPPDARCLEVGAGNGSIAAWLCSRVGVTGHVVATDLDTRFLQVIDAPNLDVRAHDITCDPLEPASYDFVHCRLLLSHLPAHEAALRNMVDALRPGGRILIEEFDHVSFLPDPSMPDAAKATWNAWLAAFDILATQRGLDLDYGRRLSTLLPAAGLTEVEIEGRTVYERGGAPGRDLLFLSIESLRPHLTATKAIDNTGVDTMLRLLSDPAFAWQSQIMVAATARKPADAQRG